MAQDLRKIIYSEWLVMDAEKQMNTSRKNSGKTCTTLVRVQGRVGR
jgi:hypothetical protein